MDSRVGNTVLHTPVFPFCCLMPKLRGLYQEMNRGPVCYTRLAGTEEGLKTHFKYSGTLVFEFLELTFWN